MARRKQALVEAEITVWPSSFPDDVGALTTVNDELSRDCDELGNRFLSDAVEQTYSGHQQWESDIEDEPYFDAKMGDALLRSFGLKSMPKRSTTRPIAGPRTPLPKLKAPLIPRDLEDYLAPPDDELDLTDDATREVSLLDHEGEEEGEVISPYVVADDVHTHGKRRGGHARTSLRPPSLRPPKR